MNSNWRYSPETPNLGQIWRGRTDRQTDGRTDGLNQSYNCLVAAKKSLADIMAKCVVFSQSPFEDLTAFRVRHFLLLVSILTSNAPRRCYSGADQRKHQSSASLAFVRGNIYENKFMRSFFNVADSQTDRHDNGHENSNFAVGAGNNNKIIFNLWHITLRCWQKLYKKS